MCIGKHLAAVLPVLFLAGCTGDAMAPGAPPDPPNRPPVVTGAIPDQRLAGPGATTALDVAAHFSDPDGDALAYGGRDFGHVGRLGISDRKRGDTDRRGCRRHGAGDGDGPRSGRCGGTGNVRSEGESPAGGVRTDSRSDARG